MCDVVVQMVEDKNRDCKNGKSFAHYLVKSSHLTWHLQPIVHIYLSI